MYIVLTLGIMCVARKDTADLRVLLTASCEDAVIDVRAVLSTLPQLDDCVDVFLGEAHRPECDYCHDGSRKSFPVFVLVLGGHPVTRWARERPSEHTLTF